MDLPFQAVIKNNEDPLSEPIWTSSQSPVLLPICSMVLVYLPTKLGDFVRANFGKYSIHGAYMAYPPVIKHCVLENGPYKSMIFLHKTSIDRG